MKSTKTRWLYRIARRQLMRNAKENLAGISEEKCDSVFSCVDGKIVLKLIWEKQVMKLWSEIRMAQHRVHWRPVMNTAVKQVACCLLACGTLQDGSSVNVTVQRFLLSPYHGSTWWWKRKTPLNPSGAHNYCEHGKWRSRGPELPSV